MDTGSIEAAGAKPIQSLLGRIAAIQSRKDLVAMLVGLELQIGLGPMRVTNVSDPENADQVIAGVEAGGLSLPDRDHYFSDDANSKSIRDEFVMYARNLLQLLGDSQESAAAAATTVLEFETTLANATLTNIARRDPY